VNGCEDVHTAAAAIALENVGGEDPLHKFRPRVVARPHAGSGFGGTCPLGTKRINSFRWRSGIIGMARGSCARLLFQVLHLYAIPHGADPPAGPRPGGDPAGHRGPVKLGEQGLIAGEAVGFLRVGLRAQSVALEQPGDPAGDASGDPRHIGRSGRSQRLEVRELPIGGSVDAVERHYVGFPTMSTTVAGTALIGLLWFFGADIV